MQPSSLMNFDLLKVAMENRKYLAEKRKSSHSQAEFIKSLEQNQYTYLQILELIKIVQDKQIKSLLIAHLLGKKEYLAQMQGESVLTRLTNNEVHAPSRLNALVHQLVLKNLTPEQIKKLQPEAAISILCSIPHFHELTENQVLELVNRCGHPNVFAYWLNHYSSMPNAYMTLAQLMKVANTYVITELDKMDRLKRKDIIKTIITHLELFDPQFILLYEENKEEHLILAMNQYINGKNHPHTILYINQLTNQLLSKSYHFSLSAIQLLLSLNGDPNFIELNNQTDYLTKHYIRTNAKAGDIGLFYNQGKLNILSMTQPLQLTPGLPAHVPEKSFLNSLLSLEIPGVVKQETWDNIPENKIIKELAKTKKSIKALDYFLLHYRGSKKSLTRIMHDYLSYHSQESGSIERRRLSLYHTSILMNRTEVGSTIREEIYSSFLNSPQLLDEQTGFILFVYDAKRTLRHFGLQGGEINYKIVQNLCAWALKKLDPNKHQELINITTKAQSEAQLELGFNEKTGFFARLIQRIKRCWHYGWTGFFTPNMPTYVAIAPKPLKIDTELKSDAAQETHESSYKPKIDLYKLLNEIKKPYTLVQLDEVITALSAFQLKAAPKNELEIRIRLNNLFHNLLIESKNDKGIDSWLKNNQSLLIASRIRLLELVLIKGSEPKLKSLLKQMNDDSTQFQFIVTEFNQVLPEPNPEQIIQIEPTPEIAPNLIDSTTDYVTSLLNWATGGVGGLFTLTQQKPNQPNMDIGQRQEKRPPSLSK